MDELIRQLYLRQTLRSFLGAAARGIGSIALASMVLAVAPLLGAPGERVGKQLGTKTGRGRGHPPGGGRPRNLTNQGHER